MPLLDQPDLSIYGQQQLYKGPTMPAASQASQGRGSAGPTKGQLDFVSEEQQRQDVSALAQQYGSDYDGLVNAVSQKYPETGYKLAQELEKRRQEAAKSDVERSKSKAAQLDDAATFIKGAMENPAIYPDVRNAAVQKFGALADRFLPQPTDPDLQNKLAGVLKTTQDTNTYLKGRSEAAQQFVDGKKMEGALGLLAISNTPETRKASEQALTTIGMGSLSQAIPDAATAQDRLAAYQAQQPQKAEYPEVFRSKAIRHEMGERARKDLRPGHDHLADMDAMIQQREKLRLMRGKPIVVAGGGGGSMDTPTIKPGTALYRTAQDLAYGKLTFSQFAPR